MAVIEVYPIGVVEFGDRRIGDERVIVFEMIDQHSGDRVRVHYHPAAFVLFADHLRMVADGVADGSFFET